MRRILTLTIIVLLAISLTGLVLFFSDDGFSGGRGMGAQNNQDSQGQRSLLLLVIVVPLVVVLVVAAYMVFFPRIEIEKKIENPEETPTASTPTEKSQKLDAVLRVLNPDEQKVVEAIASSEEGNMLQKDIRWKTGLSRVKTHRVLARLAARRIVKIEKYYNTNRVALADWIAKNENTEG
jgi:uncharacterized membrane protein